MLYFVCQSKYMGFYKGLQPMLVGEVVSSTFKFTSFEFCKKFCDETFPAEYQYATNFVSAAVSMLVCSFTLVPGFIDKS